MELSLRPATFCRRTRIAPIATETMVTDRSGPALAQCTMRGKATAIRRLRRSQSGSGASDARLEKIEIGSPGSAKFHFTKSPALNLQVPFDPKHLQRRHHAA